MLRLVAWSALALCFGVADLLLSHRGGGLFWLSNMSAIWLLLAFGVGAGAARPLTAAAGGLLVTVLALGGFYLAAHDTVVYVAPSDARYLAGGLVTGPLFGWLGRLWWVHGRWVAGMTLAAAFCLEPLAWRSWEGYLPSPHVLWFAEVTAGLLLAVVIAVRAIRPVGSGRGREPVRGN